MIRAFVIGVVAALIVYFLSQSQSFRNVAWRASDGKKGGTPRDLVCPTGCCVCSQWIPPNYGNPTCASAYPTFSFTCPPTSTVSQVVASSLSQGVDIPASSGMPQDTNWTFLSGDLAFGKSYQFTFTSATLQVTGAGSQLPTVMCSYLSNETSTFNPAFMGGVDVQVDYQNYYCGGTPASADMTWRYYYQLQPSIAQNTGYGTTFTCSAPPCTFSMQVCAAPPGTVTRADVPC